MTHAAQELQAALVALSRADETLGGLLGEGRIEDGARRAAAYPNIAFGAWESRSIAADGWPGEEHRLEILVFSQGGGRKEALGLMARLDDVVAAAEITLAGHRLVSLAKTGERVTRSRDGRSWRGTLVYRAVTEPV